MKKYQDNRYTVKRFFAYQNYLKSILTEFTSRNILHLIITFFEPDSKIFRSDEQLYYNKICRILIFDFLQNEGPLRILNSKRKEKKTEKGDHLIVFRYLLKDLQLFYKANSYQEES